MSRYVNLGTIMVSDVIPSNTTTHSPHNCNKTSCTGVVWIFFNDANTVSSWGTISRLASHNNDSDIVCRQLGYRKAMDKLPQGYERPRIDNDVPIWLKINSTCRNQLPSGDELPNNILQCKPSVCEPGECNHDNDLIVSCSGDYHEDRDYYDGEAYLCPPTEKPPGMQTTLGIVQIALKHGGDRVQIRPISLGKSSDMAYHFQAAKRDSLCRQLGFTRAQSDGVYTVAALNYSFNDCYTTDNSWFNVDELKDHCSGDEDSSTPCFGCCYDYPIPEGCSLTNCRIPNNSIIISCEFDPFNHYRDHTQKGSQRLCEFKESKMPEAKSVCKQSVGLSPFVISNLAWGISFSIILMVTMLVIGLYVCTRCRRPPPDQPPGDADPPPAGAQAGDQQPGGVQEGQQGRPQPLQQFGDDARPNERDPLLGDQHRHQ